MRHPTYDYTLPGAYFVTVCVQDRRHLLGEVRLAEMSLSTAGHIVAATLDGLDARFPTALLDCFVVMPNHIHAVIGLGARERSPSGEGAMNRAATGDSGSTDPKLGDVVRTFKAVSSKAIRAVVAPTFAWQSDYHDRIIRNDRELATIRDYVQHNPDRWDEDTFNSGDVDQP